MAFFQRFAFRAARAAGHVARMGSKRGFQVPLIASGVAFGALAFSADVQADIGLPASVDDAVKGIIDAASNEVARHVNVGDVVSQVVWNAVRKDIEAILDDENAHNPGKDGFPGNSGGGGAIGPMFVRLAWHCAGTYCKDQQNGGSDGATMRFSPEKDHGGNAGLGAARDLLEPLYQKYKGFGITHADLYIFSGNVSIEYMAGPDLPFRPGRTDAEGAATPTTGSVHSPDGRLPDADGRGIFPGDHVRDIFYRMGFNDREIVALSGAHGLGHCHTDRSGFWGPWTFAPTTFSNEYYRLLMEEKWSVKQTHNGKKWEGPEQYENSTGELMMLPTDMALVWDPRFKKYVAEYYKDEEVFFNDFAAAWTKLTENGCKLSTEEIINLERKLSNNEVVQEAIEQALRGVSKAIGAAPAQEKGKGWWPF